MKKKLPVVPLIVKCSLQVLGFFFSFHIWQKLLTRAPQFTVENVIGVQSEQTMENWFQKINNKTRLVENLVLGVYVLFLVLHLAVNQENIWRYRRILRNRLLWPIFRLAANSDKEQNRKHHKEFSHAWRQIEFWTTRIFPTTTMMKTAKIWDQEPEKENKPEQKIGRVGTLL